MNQIYAHITGIDDNSKKILINFINKTSRFKLQDLDEFSEKIIEDKQMIYYFEKMEYYKEKLDDTNLSKSLIKQYQTHIKVLDRKMKIYWKIKMNESIEELLDNSDKYIILIGYSTYYKNHKIGINIKSSLKFFQKIDINTHVKSVIEHHLDKYRKDIIEGTFPMEFLTHKELSKKRENLIAYYNKLGYKLETINNIINYLHISYNNPIPEILFFASEKNFNKRIPLNNNKLICYDLEWIAMISNLKIEKGYNGNKPFININNVDDLNIPINLYVITNTSSFLPIFSKGMIYKYESNIPVDFTQKIQIDNIYDKLLLLKIKINKK